MFFLQIRKVIESIVYGSGRENMWLFLGVVAKFASVWTPLLFLGRAICVPRVIGHTFDQMFDLIGKSLICLGLTLMELEIFSSIFEKISFFPG